MRGMDTCDDRELRRSARDAIKQRLLPGIAPTHTWGGPGNGSRCPVCGNTLAPDGMAFDLEFASSADTRPLSYQLHVKCLQAWERERDSLRNEANAPNLLDSEGTITHARARE